MSGTPGRKSTDLAASRTRSRPVPTKPIALSYYYKKGVSLSSRALGMKWFA
jgi:hypothetical protein